MWSDKRLHSLLGALSIGALIYLNFGGDFSQYFPFLWQPKMSFVEVNNTHFSVDGRALYVNGWNSYWLMEQSIWPSSRPKVRKIFRRAADMGMTVCRTWAFNDGGTHALQISPRNFDEKVFEALDFVIVEARKYKIRLILSLVNNLNAFGGKRQYVKWAQEDGVNVTFSDDSFFSDLTIKGYFKDYIKTILTRKNSFSGVRYSEEPAIFAWELINEPRCVSNSSAPLLQAWINEMAAHIKFLDHKHLVTVGLEGFYGPTTPEKSNVNPGSWAASLGSDFIQDSKSEYIDFASVHSYPDSWIPNARLEEKVKYLSKWVDSHINDGENVLKKPVLFTEVGSLRGNMHDPHGGGVLLEIVYDKIFESARKKQAGAGALVWQLTVQGLDKYGDEFSLVAWDQPSIYKLMLEQSCRLKVLCQGSEMGSKISKSAPCS
ncbi:hypothetical protein AMTRI_Chr10g229390 [Amborella trichopoda]|uniref:mannan endo-1,4-beta-mannosidase n=1 Tax=Amborella trichopoda TaxID=13333 RepID=W1P404_AMBTC|nr:mannan endo-1,4-beta-mannosidase 6 [Amborella trichopoda]ERN01665.1 hypothetical protein AMTR_s00090p00128510 [Amborella trichopoda]|eukprot:XP_006839096.1 mannan endo-1,4-beta-mannosidase 6 [Amborella trichopoda]